MKQPFGVRFSLGMTSHSARNKANARQTRRERKELPLEGTQMGMTPPRPSRSFLPTSPARNRSRSFEESLGNRNSEFCFSFHPVSL